MWNCIPARRLFVGVASVSCCVVSLAWSASGLVADDRWPESSPILQEVQFRSPRIAAAQRRAAAAGYVEAQVTAMPDPEVSTSVFLSPVETRSGAQRAQAGISQTFPAAGKRHARGESAKAEAQALALDAEWVAVQEISQARRVLRRLALVDEQRRILSTDLEALREIERSVRGRYAAGKGSGQPVIKLQAEITRVQLRDMELTDRRNALVQQLGRLRGRFTAVAMRSRPVTPRIPPLERRQLLSQAISQRPDLKAISKRQSGRAARERLARMQSKPDLRLGLSYTVVEPRDDGAIGVPDDGDDIVALTAGMKIPLSRAKRVAAERQAKDERLALEETRRDAIDSLDALISDRIERVASLGDQRSMMSTVLLPQAEESLRAARFGYESGLADVIDVLDAKRVLLEVRLSIARTEIELDLALVDIEEAMAGPLVVTEQMPMSMPMPMPMPKDEEK